MQKKTPVLPKIKDLMVPRTEYATVSHTATLWETMRSLENAKKKYDDRPYRHRSVLVLNDAGRVVGKVSQVDIMRALEPNYQSIGSDISLSRFGFSAGFIASMESQYHLWKRSVDKIMDDLDRIRVTEVMYKPADHERIKASDELTTAIHHFVMGRHQALLITERKRVIGILRSTDAYNALYEWIESVHGRR